MLIFPNYSIYNTNFEITIPMLCIINKFNILEANKLLVASTIPSSFSSLWCFCDSKKVISSGKLVIKPKAIPRIISDIKKILANSSKTSLNLFPIQYNNIDVISRYIVYFNTINIFELLFIFLSLLFVLSSYELKYKLCKFEFI